MCVCLCSWATVFKKNIIFTCKQPLMMADERSESDRENFGKIHQPMPT